MSPIETSTHKSNGRSLIVLPATVFLFSVLWVGAVAASAPGLSPGKATDAAVRAPGAESSPGATASVSSESAAASSTGTSPATTAPAPVPHFDHKAHGERGVEACSDCHDLPKEGRAMLPTMENCSSCHEVDPAKEGPACGQCHSRSAGKLEPWRWSLAVGTPGVSFQHQVHLEAKIDCSACHGKMAENARVTTAVRPKMELCLDCHRKQDRAAVRCSVCHDAEAKKLVPPSHRERDWGLRHGHLARRGKALPLKLTCTFCHPQSDCSSCHQDQMPRDHTQQFRVRGHSLLSGMERDRCATCHRQDFCIRCHQTSPPATGPNRHTGGFLPPSNRHCVTCHSSRNASCSVCHQGGARHATAPMLPPIVPHLAANPVCRNCHRQGAGLTHHDPGTPDCRTCHRGP
ncbi:MAG: cytochrome c3 family protein [Candidatus Riflebacteria bacterium]|nr:cytochrome c3 family protein [Candidatus Riflebacteria bacterium]